MKYNPEIHHRQSIRLKNYDYAANGAYFVTICAQERECLFGDIHEGKMEFNGAGRMVEEWWMALNERFPQTALDEYVIMPNHFHGIVMINDHVGAGSPRSIWYIFCRGGVSPPKYAGGAIQLKKERVIVVDVETTGLSTRNGGRVIEIGAVKVEDGNIVAELATLIDTGASISYGAYRVHGISEAMLIGKPLPEDVWPLFLEFAGDAHLVAHNAVFDSGFISHELALLGMSLPNRWHCTVRLARKKLPQLSNHRLETVAMHLLGEIPADCRRHRALGDARLASKVWVELMNNQ